MNKVAIFIEGQTEQIFVKELIYQLYGYQSTRVFVVKKKEETFF